MRSKRTEVLVVDDEPEIGQVIADALGGANLHCETVTNGATAYSKICRRDYDVVISDIAMPEMNGLELLDKVVSLRPQSRVILITGYGSTEYAKQAIRRGAFEYLEKPFDIAHLRHVVDEAVRDGQQGPARDQAVFHPRGKTAASGVRLNRDPLTGLLNHRCFYEELTRLRAHCRRGSHPLSLLVVDIDDFNRVNVGYGHAFGDFALKECARRLQLTCRDGDILARYAGQQYAVALFNVSAEPAISLAERIRATVSKMILLYGEEEVRMSVSIGIAECDAGFIEPVIDLVQRAEEALSHAKKQGFGQIVRWDHLCSSTPTGSGLDMTGVERMMGQFRQLGQQLKKSYIESTQALIAAVEAKDPHTRRHSLNVATYAVALAGQLGLDPLMVETLETAALLHDIGKIGIPDHILTKSGTLTDEELALIRRHPIVAAQILQHVSCLKGELPNILHHHERWDGRGYPAGLAGEEIPFGARILHVADSIEAMFAQRSYKPSYAFERVLEELEGNGGAQFDPNIAMAAVAWLTSNRQQAGSIQ